MNSYLIELYKPLSLRNPLFDKYRIKIFHI